MALYRLRPVQAVQWTGTNEQQAKLLTSQRATVENGRLIFQTRDGEMVAEIGEWIVRRHDGEIFVMPAVDFAATYEQLTI
jgi:hypothetical protein